MGAAITQLLLPLGVWILNKFFEKQKSDVVSKERFLLFVDALERDGLVSVRLNKSDREQLVDLKLQRSRLQRSEDGNP